MKFPELRLALVLGALLTTATYVCLHALHWNIPVYDLFVGFCYVQAGFLTGNMHSPNEILMYLIVYFWQSLAAYCCIRIVKMRLEKVK